MTVIEFPPRRVSGIEQSTVREVAEERIGNVTADTIEKWADAMPYIERMAGIDD